MRMFKMIVFLPLGLLIAGLTTLFCLGYFAFAFMGRGLTNWVMK